MAGKGGFLGKPSCCWEVTYLGEAGAWESSGAEPGGASCVANTGSEEMQPLTSPEVLQSCAESHPEDRERHGGLLPALHCLRDAA